MNNTLKYYDPKRLNEKLILMGGAMELFQQEVTAVDPWYLKVKE